jgi:hypothetical protein
MGMNETPVFVAEHPRRKRALHAAVATGGALLLAWLVAVVIGALGFGSLPGVPFGSNDDQPQTASEHSAKPAGPGAKKHPSSSAAAQANGSKRNGTNGSGSGSGSKSSSATAGHHGTATASPPVSIGTSNAHGANPYAGGANAGGISATAGGAKPTSTPSGTAPGAYAHGANPNAGGANRSDITTGKGTTTTG